MSVKRKPTKRKPAKTSSRGKLASDVTYIKLARLFFPSLSGNPLDAAQELQSQLSDENKLNDTQARILLRSVYRHLWLSLLNMDAQNPAGGPRGPRLPNGLTLIDLLPHLSRAKQALASKEIPFERWVREYADWPAGMKVHPRTVRGWLDRYSRQIYAYEYEPEPVKPRKSAPGKYYRVSSEL